MKRKNIIFLFLFLVVLPLSFAVEPEIDVLILNETFNYNDSYTNHGWQSITSCGDGFNVPTNETFGYNGNNSYCTQQEYLRRKLGTNLTNNGGVVFTFEDTVDTLHSGSRLTLILQNQTGGFSMRITFAETTFSPVETMTIDTSIAKGENCSLEYTIGESSEYFLALDFDDGVYNLYKDDVLVEDCTDKSIGTLTQLATIDLLTFYGSPENVTRYFDNFLIYKGDFLPTGGDCEFPSIFCDNFNYLIPLTDKSAPYDWSVFNQDGSEDTSVVPIDNVLVLNTSEYKRPYHDIDPFELNYDIADGVTVNSGVYSAQFSSEFELNLSVGNITYNTYDRRFNSPVYSIRGRVTGDSTTWYYKDSSNIYQVICSNCSSSNQTHDIKIIANFAQRIKMPFNSTFATDEVLFYLDGVEYDLDIPFIEAATQNQNKHEFIKDANSVFTLDEYYVYVGSDRFTNTLDNVQSSIFEKINISYGDGEGDLATQIDDLWDSIGLRSTASRIIAGLIFLLFANVAILSMVLAAKVQLTGIGIPLAILNIIFVLIMSYVKLLPFWILVVVIIGVSGTGALAALFASKNG